MKSTFVAMAALLVLVGCAPATAQRPRLSLGTSTKADVLNVNGPPQKREMFEGDEFWYYAERVVNPWESAGHALQNFNAGVHGGAVPPPTGRIRVLIFRFDAAGNLKAVIDR